MFMATSVWSEVVYLDCDAIEVKKGITNTSLAVDTEARLVKVGGAEVGYTEYGNRIEFQEMSSSLHRHYSLDRVAGTLQELSFDKGTNGKLRLIMNYKCTRTDPLF
tara:strand:+ start:267 stop:584 length:318 start_codon:yes stop_codon:yes gene_type:complete